MQSKDLIVALSSSSSALPIKEIKVIDFKWKTSVLFISGYYEFEISIKDKDKDKDRDLTSTIFRRFSDIELLHDGLVKTSPGCLIPPLPSKSFWLNVYASNNQNGIHIRKKHIEDYLLYIISHKYLSMSAIFQSFLSDYQFALYKKELAEEKKTHQSKVMSMLTKLFDSGSKGVAQYNNKFGDIGEDNEGDEYDEDDYGDNTGLNAIEKEEAKIYKIHQGAKTIIAVLIKEISSINLNRKRIKTLIDNNSDNDNDNKDCSNEPLIDVFNSIQERKLIYEEKMNKLLKESFEPLCVISKGMTEIFQRKHKLEMFLYKEHQEDFITNNKKIEIEQCTKILNGMHPHLNEELMLFKSKKAKELIESISLFFQLKHEYETDLKQCLNQPKISKPMQKVIKDSFID